MISMMKNFRLIGISILNLNGFLNILVQTCDFSHQKWGILVDDSVGKGVVIDLFY